MSFLFIFQNDNDLIDNDNAGQSPAAQAVVLTLTLTYYLLNTVPSYVLLYVSVPILSHIHATTLVSRFASSARAYCKSLRDLSFSDRDPRSDIFHRDQALPFVSKER